MLHARMFGEQARIRDEHFQPRKSSLKDKTESAEPAYLDGNVELDRPLLVQFCANKADELLEAAQYVAPYCDAVDLNLGCPQGIARSGKYGAFLQEDWETIYALINKLHTELAVPVTAKMRILETRDQTLEYAKMILSAGASILTVHGRRREQKGHNTGIADWSMIRYLRDNLPVDTVLFANGNILNAGDVQACLDATGADGVMSAEGNLADPTVFADPPLDASSREYWHGPEGRGGYRVDGVVRRYLDIIHQYVLEQKPPDRPPLYIPGDMHPSQRQKPQLADPSKLQPTGPRGSKRKRDNAAHASPNLRFMQGHLFQVLRSMITIHTDIRDALARSRTGDIAAFENVLSMVEEAVANGLDEEAAMGHQANRYVTDQRDEEHQMTGSAKTIAKYKRPWWVCQPNIRPLPEEALEKGSMQLTKKQKAKLAVKTDREAKDAGDFIKRDDDLDSEQVGAEAEVEVPKRAMVCG